MGIREDFNIDFENKTIEHIGYGGTVYTCVEFYSWLMDTFDGKYNINKCLPIVAHTKSSFSMINGWNITREALRFLCRGVFAASGVIEGRDGFVDTGSGKAKHVIQQ